MKRHLKRVIPVFSYIDDEKWQELMEKIRPFVKKLGQEELFGTMILTDCVQGVELAEKLQLPCLGLETDTRLYCTYVALDLQAVTETLLERAFRRFYHIPWDILESRRCILREGSTEDVEEILAVYEDIETFALTKPFATTEEGRAYMEEYREMVYRLYEYGLWVIEDKENGHLIGVAGLENQIFGEKEFLALGYVIRKEWRTKGYAGEICSQILAYANEELGVDVLYSFVEPENEASRKLLGKLGFAECGSVRQEAGQNGGRESILHMYRWEASPVGKAT